MHVHAYMQTHACMQTAHGTPIECLGHNSLHFLLLIAHSVGKVSPTRATECLTGLLPEDYHGSLCMFLVVCVILGLYTTIMLEYF